MGSGVGIVQVGVGHPGCGGDSLTNRVAMHAKASGGLLPVAPVAQVGGHRRTRGPAQVGRRRSASWSRATTETSADAAPSVSLIAPGATARTAARTGSRGSVLERRGHRPDRSHPGRPQFPDSAQRPLCRLGRPVRHQQRHGALGRGVRLGQRPEPPADPHVPPDPAGRAGPRRSAGRPRPRPRRPGAHGAGVVVPQLRGQVAPGVQHDRRSQPDDAGALRTPRRGAGQPVVEHRREQRARRQDHATVGHPDRALTTDGDEPDKGGGASTDRAGERVHDHVVTVEGEGGRGVRPAARSRSTSSRSRRATVWCRRGQTSTSSPSGPSRAAQPRTEFASTRTTAETGLRVVAALARSRCAPRAALSVRATVGGEQRPVRPGHRQERCRDRHHEQGQPCCRAGRGSSARTSACTEPEPDRQPGQPARPAGWHRPGSG